MTEVDEANALAELAETAHALSRTLQRSGEQHLELEALPGSEYDALRFIAAHPGCSVSELARALRLHASNVSATVGSLVERGLLERSRDPRDRRRTALHASTTALQHRELLHDAWAQILTQALDRLPAQDVDKIRAAVPALTRLADALMTGKQPHDTAES